MEDDEYSQLEDLHLQVGEKVNLEILCECFCMSLSDITASLTDEDLLLTAGKIIERFPVGKGCGSCKQLMIRNLERYLLSREG